jgi:hypothetical protein
MAGQHGATGHVGASGATGTVAGASGSNLPDTYSGGIYVVGGKITIHP